MSGQIKRLYRSRSERMLGGICGGLGDYLSLDPTLIRLVVVLLAFVATIWPVILAYLVLWILVPLEPAGERLLESSDVAAA